jgi:two-component sensor histidine kinase
MNQRGSMKGDASPHELAPPQVQSSAATGLTELGPATSLAQALVDCSVSPLLLLDPDLRIVGASRSFCTAFDVDHEKVKGTRLSDLGTGEWNVPQLRSLLMTTFAGSAVIDAYELNLVRQGHEPACLVLNALKLDHDGELPMIILTLTDVTSARIAEKQKDALIEEKRILLQELQHRIANSLQIIASVLMQSARQVQSEETRLHLQNAHNRVLSIAQLQRQLAQSGNDQVRLRPYFQGLCDSIRASMLDDEGLITLRTTVDDSSAPPNVSTSLGLIVTELVINSLKHAFPRDEVAGDIEVVYRAEGDGFALSVSDNGVGIASSEEPTGPGLGTGIVSALARQLGATVETTDLGPGTKVTVARPA